ncbi:MAG TPA: sugar phosphate isomerase/epimerase [Trebonia sp.]|nr:sugar phosphate isomerase/epimerase [Trebonia sp.]
MRRDDVVSDDVVSADGLRRLSLNQWTVRNWSVREAVDGCARHGIESIGLWREHVADFGLAETARLVGDAGIRVSSLCRGGFFSRPGWQAVNRTAVDEAAVLGAECLVLVPGGLPDANGSVETDNSKMLPQARERVAEALEVLVPYARERGVRLAIEPMHPMYCADRGVVSTLKQALDLAAPHPAASVGVVVDTFHLWWDPEVTGQIARAGRAGRIASFQVSDFLRPLPADVLLGRAVMGDGVIDFGPMCRAVADAGYGGDVEVEIFNADVWAADPDDVLARVRARYADLIAGHLSPGDR